MAEVEITIASSNKLPVLQELFREMFELYSEDQNVEYPYTQAGIDYLKRCIVAGSAFIAWYNGTAAGFLTGGITEALAFKAYSHQGHLHNLYVRSDYRGVGIGRNLIERFVRFCREQRTDRIITDSEDTEALRSFYGSLGFRVTGVEYEMKLDP